MTFDPVWQIDYMMICADSERDGHAESTRLVMPPLISIRREPIRSYSAGYECGLFHMNLRQAEWDFNASKQRRVCAPNAKSAWKYIKNVPRVTSSPVFFSSLIFSIVIRLSILSLILKDVLSSLCVCVCVCVFALSVCQLYFVNKTVPSYISKKNVPSETR